MKSLFLISFFCLVLSCVFDSDCGRGYICIRGRCGIDHKLEGESCYVNSQCGYCCTNEYKCVDYKTDNVICNDSFDLIGFIVAMIVFLGVSIGAWIIGIFVRKKCIEVDDQ